MVIYHIDDKGIPKRCWAKVWKCRYGEPKDHYLDPAMALEAVKIKNLHPKSPAAEARAKAIILSEIELLEKELFEKAILLGNAETQEEREYLETSTKPIAIIRAALVDELY